MLPTLLTKYLCCAIISCKEVMNMIKKDKHTFKYGTRTQIRVIEGYRPSPNAPVKHKTIKNFGYLENQENPIEFMKTVEEYDRQYKSSKRVSITHPTNIKFNEDRSGVPYNYGYRFLETIYDTLRIDTFINRLNFKGDYNVSEVFKFLVLQRILNPDSKRATTQLIQSFYNKDYNFQLYDVYRALDKFDDLKVDLQKFLNDQIKAIIGRDSSIAFYDVTNYYFDIDFPDEEGLRQRGVSKEHRVDPIVQLGLFIDCNGIPVSMSLFKGNTSDTKTLQPIMEEIKKSYNLQRLIVTADKGLNSSSNIDYICNNNDGYVVSQTLKGKKGKRYHDELFSEEGYVYNSNQTFKHKIFIEDYMGLDSKGNGISRKRKVLIYWKKEDADLARRKRTEKVLRAEKALRNNVYGIKHGYENYILETHTIAETGEVSNHLKKSLNQDKIEDESKYDGYFCIITSEINFDHKKILDIYSGLWRIEESFRITKSDLEARPVYVSTDKHINGHFLICYVALLIIRMMQYKMGNNSLSAERMVRALNACKCELPSKGVVHVLRDNANKKYKKIEAKDGKLIDTLAFEDDDEIMQDFKKIVSSYNVDFFFSYSKQNDFNKYLDSIKYI